MKRLYAFIAACAATLVLLFMGTATASAASYAKGVYTPEVTDGHIVGKANMNTDCEGTLGCYTYVKLEYRPELQPWLQYQPAFHDQAAWRDAEGGHWADNGWNTVTANLDSLPSVPAGTGCGYIRMTALSYNDVVAGAPLNIGVSIGHFELSTGDGVQRFEAKNSSQEIYVCPRVV